MARARKLMTATKALDIAMRRLRKSRMPTLLAAAFTLAELRQDLLDRQEADCRSSDRSLTVQAAPGRLIPASSLQVDPPWLRHA
jgi:hypothetical protein